MSTMSILKTLACPLLLYLIGKAYYTDTRLTSSETEDCDPSSIPVMEKFDMHKFSGAWFELAKSASGYLEVDDGMWKIMTTNTSSTFLFSGRDNNAHCIRPIKGKMHSVDQPPGTLTLHYQTYTTHVEETIRVLFTDYTSIAVIYMCVHHIHREKEVCHSAGLMGAVWTREPHVMLDVYETALRYLEMACVHRSVLIVRNLIGPCKVDDAGFHIDDFPVPDFCYQPRDMGFCRGNIQRYYYDPKLRRCENFTYHGCGGNRNNFMSLTECQDKCLSISPHDPVCMSVGKCAIHCAPCCTQDRTGCVQCNCNTVIDDKGLVCKKSPASCTPECEVEEFYPRCYICSCTIGINEPFDDVPDCNEAKAEGNCEEMTERYYFNVFTGECEKFNYTGCNGNNNNFATLEQCYEKCLDTPTMKAVPLDDSATDIKCNVWITGTLLLLLIISSKVS